MTNVLLFIAGFIWGTAVSIFNTFWTKRTLEGSGGKKAQVIFIFRLLICAVAMLLVMNFKAALLGTALGLVSIKNYILLKTIKDMHDEKRDEKERGDL